MSVRLTEKAAEHVQKMLQQRGSGIGLRLGMKKSGCSGYAYEVDYADEVEAGELVFDSNGIKVIVHQDNLEYLNGLELDYVKQNALNQGFEFNNPNVKDMCGCGESITF
jgi:iron-sulfur cluster assembly protein